MACCAWQLNKWRHTPWPVTRGDDTTPEGIRNLCTNVSEWTAPFDPPAGIRARAGTFAVGASYQDGNCFFHTANPLDPSKRLPYVGFRCALSLERAQEVMGNPEESSLRIRGR